MAAQRYIIIKLLEQLHDGDEFFPENYPLHITIVPSFQLEHLNDVLLNKIKQLCGRFQAFTLTAGGDELFGPNREARVTTMTMNDKIQELHDSLVSLLSDAGAIFDETQYMSDNYRAHATVRETIRLYKGESIIVDSITVVDKLPDGLPTKRKLLKTLNFSDAE